MGAALCELKLRPLTLGLTPDPVFCRESKGRMELQGLQGPLDLLGPGALPVTLEKTAPGALRAQR